MVVAELRGERIDVIPWDEDPARFVANALSPGQGHARARRRRDAHRHRHRARRQLSLAIGKEGQNARLAAKLTGWRIDIKSEAQAAEQGLVALRAGGEGGEEESHDGRCEAMIGPEGAMRCRNKALPGQTFCRLHCEEEAS